MSEFRTVEVPFIESNEKVLIDALKEMGYKPEVHAKAVELATYGGSGTKPKAHIVIKKGQFGGYTDAGFERVNGKYEIHIDSMDTRRFKLDRLKQNYNVSNLKKVLSSSRYSIRKKVEEKKSQAVKVYIDVLY